VLTGELRLQRRNLALQGGRGQGRGGGEGDGAVLEELPLPAVELGRLDVNVRLTELGPYLCALENSHASHL
jgi:hypothetical protein